MIPKYCIFEITVNPTTTGGIQHIIIEHTDYWPQFNRKPGTNTYTFGVGVVASAASQILIDVLATGPIPYWKMVIKQGSDANNATKITDAENTGGPGKVKSGTLHNYDPNDTGSQPLTHLIRLITLK